MVCTEPLSPAVAAAHQKSSTGGGGHGQTSTEGEETQIVWTILRYAGIGPPNRNLLYLRLLRLNDVLLGRVRHSLDRASQTVASDAVAISIQTVGISRADLDRMAKVRAVEIRSRRGWSR
ncbi:hypothetical protein [Arthrobacter pigmenti]